ncbi:hypothetical protein IHE44_0013718 [Lamprotornis superbus]|uniref:Uncharacterized protein n=1 Tax=Lamprotornis superbus TaxID=245042 RepID=A0A835P0C2_9PASS|nr:hypothetical protein IHE44_0013718 [Lamprotornis superbus]
MWITQGEPQKSCSKPVAEKFTESCQEICQCRPPPLLPPPPPPPPPPRLLAVPTPKSTFCPTEETWWPGLVIIIAVCCTTLVFLFVVVIICYKAIKRLLVNAERFGLANCGGQLVPHKELLFKSAVILVDGSNRWEEQKLNLKRKIQSCLAKLSSALLLLGPPSCTSPGTETSVTAASLKNLSPTSTEEMLRSEVAAVIQLYIQSDTSKELQVTSKFPLCVTGDCSIGHYTTGTPATDVCCCIDQAPKETICDIVLCCSMMYRRVFCQRALLLNQQGKWADDSQVVLDTPFIHCSNFVKPLFYICVSKPERKMRVPHRMGRSLLIHTRIVDSYCLSATLIAMEGFYTLLKRDHISHPLSLFCCLLPIAPCPEGKGTGRVPLCRSVTLMGCASILATPEPLGPVLPLLEGLHAPVLTAQYLPCCRVAKQHSAPCSESLAEGETRGQSRGWQEMVSAGVGPLHSTPALLSLQSPLHGRHVAIPSGVAGLENDAAGLSILESCWLISHGSHHSDRSSSCVTSEQILLKSNKLSCNMISRAVKETFSFCIIILALCRALAQIFSPSPHKTERKGLKMLKTMLDYLTSLSGDGNMGDICKSLGRQTLSSSECVAKSCPDGAAFYYNCKTFALYVGATLPQDQQAHTQPSTCQHQKWGCQMELPRELCSERIIQGSKPPGGDRCLLAVLSRMGTPERAFPDAGLGALALNRDIAVEVVGRNSMKHWEVYEMWIALGVLNSLAAFCFGQIFFSHCQTMQSKTNVHPGFLSGHKTLVPLGLHVCGNSQAPMQSQFGTWLPPSYVVPWYCNTPVLSVLYKDVPELQKSDLDFERIPACGCFSLNVEMWHSLRLVACLSESVNIGHRKAAAGGLRAALCLPRRLALSPHIAAWQGEIPAQVQLTTLHQSDLEKDTWRSILESDITLQKREAGQGMSLRTTKISGVERIFLPPVTKQSDPQTAEVKVASFYTEDKKAELKPQPCCPSCPSPDTAVCPGKHFCLGQMLQKQTWKERGKFYEICALLVVHKQRDYTPAFLQPSKAHETLSLMLRGWKFHKQKQFMTSPSADGHGHTAGKPGSFGWDSPLPVLCLYQTEVKSTEVKSTASELNQGAPTACTPPSQQGSSFPSQRRRLNLQRKKDVTLESRTHLMPNTISSKSELSPFLKDVFIWACLIHAVKTKALTATFKLLSCCFCLAPWHSLICAWGLAIVLSVLPAQPVWCEHPGRAVSPGTGSFPEQQTQSTWDVLGATGRGTNALMECAVPQGIFSGERRDGASAGHTQKELRARTPSRKQKRKYKEKQQHGRHIPVNEPDPGKKSCLSCPALEAAGCPHLSTIWVADKTALTDTDLDCSKSFLRKLLEAGEESIRNHQVFFVCLFLMPPHLKYELRSPNSVFSCIQETRWFQVMVFLSQSCIQGDCTGRKKKRKFSKQLMNVILKTIILGQTIPSRSLAQSGVASSAEDNQRARGASPSLQHTQHRLSQQLWAHGCSEAQPLSLETETGPKLGPQGGLESTWERSPRSQPSLWQGHDFVVEVSAAAIGHPLQICFSSCFGQRAPFELAAPGLGLHSAHLGWSHAVNRNDQSCPKSQLNPSDGCSLSVSPEFSTHCTDPHSGLCCVELSLEKVTALEKHWREKLSCFDEAHGADHVFLSGLMLSVAQEPVDNVRLRWTAGTQILVCRHSMQFMQPFCFFSANCLHGSHIIEDLILFGFVCLFYKCFLDLACTFKGFGQREGPSSRYPVKSVEHQSLSFSLVHVGHLPLEQRIFSFFESKDTFFSFHQTVRKEKVVLFRARICPLPSPCPYGCGCSCTALCPLPAAKDGSSIPGLFITLSPLFRQTQNTSPDRFQGAKVSDIKTLEVLLVMAGKADQERKGLASSPELPLGEVYKISTTVSGMANPAPQEGLRRKMGYNSLVQKQQLNVPLLHHRQEEILHPRNVYGSLAVMHNFILLIKDFPAKLQLFPDWQSQYDKGIETQMVCLRLALVWDQEDGNQNSLLHVLSLGIPTKHILSISPTADISQMNHLHGQQCFSSHSLLSQQIPQLFYPGYLINLLGRAELLLMEDLPFDCKKIYWFSTLEALPRCLGKPFTHQALLLMKMLFSVCCDLKKNPTKPPRKPQKTKTKATNKTVHSAHSLSLSWAITEHQPSEAFNGVKQVAIQITKKKKKKKKKKDLLGISICYFYTKKRSLPTVKLIKSLETCLGYCYSVTHRADKHLIFEQNQCLQAWSLPAHSHGLSGLMGSWLNTVSEQVTWGSALKAARQLAGSPLVSIKSVCMGNEPLFPSSASSSQSPAPCTHYNSQTMHSDSWNPPAHSYRTKAQQVTRRARTLSCGLLSFDLRHFQWWPLTPHQQTLGRPVPRVDSGSLPDHFAAWGASGHLPLRWLFSLLSLDAQTPAEIVLSKERQKKTVDRTLPELRAAGGIAQDSWLQNSFPGHASKDKQPWALVIFIQFERRLCRPEFRDIFPLRAFVSPRAHRLLSQHGKQSKKTNCVLGPLNCHGPNDTMQKHYRQRKAPGDAQADVNLALRTRMMDSAPADTHPETQLCWERGGAERFAANIKNCCSGLFQRDNSEHRCFEADFARQGKSFHHVASMHYPLRCLIIDSPFQNIDRRIQYSSHKNKEASMKPTKKSSRESMKVFLYMQMRNIGVNRVNILHGEVYIKKRKKNAAVVLSNSTLLLENHMQLCQDLLLSLPHEEPYSNLSIYRQMNAKTAGMQPDAEDTSSVHPSVGSHTDEGNQAVEQAGHGAVLAPQICCLPSSLKSYTAAAGAAQNPWKSRRKVEHFHFIAQSLKKSPSQILSFKLEMPLTGCCVNKLCTTVSLKDFKYTVQIYKCEAQNTEDIAKDLLRLKDTERLKIQAIDARCHSAPELQGCEDGCKAKFILILDCWSYCCLFTIHCPELSKYKCMEQGTHCLSLQDCWTLTTSLQERFFWSEMFCQFASARGIPALWQYDCTKHRNGCLVTGKRYLKDQKKDKEMNGKYQCLGWVEGKKGGFYVSLDGKDCPSGNAPLSSPGLHAAALPPLCSSSPLNMFPFFACNRRKCREISTPLFPKADMLHINAHADVSKGQEPKQLSPQNPGQNSLIYNSTNIFLKEKKPVSHPQILPTVSPRQVPYRKHIFVKKNSYTLDQCFPEPTFNLVKNSDKCESGPQLAQDVPEQIVLMGQACDAKLCHTCLLGGKSFHKSVSYFLTFSNVSLTPQNESSRNIVNVFFAGKLQVKRKWPSGTGDCQKLSCDPQSPSSPSHTSWGQGLRLGCEDIAGTFCNHVGLGSSASAPLPNLGQHRISMRITSEFPVPAPIAADSGLISFIDRQFEGHPQLHKGEAESENELLLQQTKYILNMRKKCPSPKITPKYFSEQHLQQVPIICVFTVNKKIDEGKKKNIKSLRRHTFTPTQELNHTGYSTEWTFQDHSILHKKQQIGFKPVGFSLSKYRLSQMQYSNLTETEHRKCIGKMPRRNWLRAAMELSSLKSIRDVAKVPTAGNCSLAINGNGGLEELLCLNGTGRQWRSRAVQKPQSSNLNFSHQKNVEEESCATFLNKFILEHPITSIPPLRKEVVQVAKTATTHNSMLMLPPCIGLHQLALPKRNLQQGRLALSSTHNDPSAMILEVSLPYSLYIASLGKEWFEIRMEETHDTYPGCSSGPSAVSQKRLGFTVSTVSAFLPANTTKAHQKDLPQFCPTGLQMCYLDGHTILNFVKCSKLLTIKMLLTITDITVVMISKTTVLQKIKGTQKKEFTIHDMHLMHKYSKFDFNPQIRGLLLEPSGKNKIFDWMSELTCLLLLSQLVKDVKRNVQSLEQSSMLNCTSGVVLRLSADTLIGVEGDETAVLPETSSFSGFVVSSSSSLSTILRGGSGSKTKESLSEVECAECFSGPDNCGGSGRGRCACAWCRQQGQEAFLSHSALCRTSCDARLTRTAGSLHSLYQEIFVLESAVFFSECFLLSHSVECCLISAGSSSYPSTQSSLLILGRRAVSTAAPAGTATALLLCLIHLQGNKKHYWDSKNRALQRKTKLTLFSIASKYGEKTHLVPGSEGASERKLFYILLFLQPFHKGEEQALWLSQYLQSKICPFMVLYLCAAQSPSQQLWKAISIFAITSCYYKVKSERGVRMVAHFMFAGSVSTAIEKAKDYPAMVTKPLSLRYTPLRDVRPLCCAQPMEQLRMSLITLGYTGKHLKDNTDCRSTEEFALTPSILPPEIWTPDISPAVNVYPTINITFNFEKSLIPVHEPENLGKNCRSRREKDSFEQCLKDLHASIHKNLYLFASDAATLGYQWKEILSQAEKQKLVSAFTYLCNSSNKGIKAGGNTHFLRCNHEASLLLIVAKQDVQMALDCVEGFGTADIRLCTALILCHELHEHCNELVDSLVVNPCILWQQSSLLHLCPNTHSEIAGEACISEDIAPLLPQVQLQRNTYCTVFTGIFYLKTLLQIGNSQPKLLLDQDLQIQKENNEF